MTEYVSSHQKLRFFLERMGMRQEESDVLAQFTPLFVGKKEAFAEYFYDFFLNIADTKHFLEGETKPGHMKRVWAACP
jgi:hypothetical protein